MSKSGEAGGAGQGDDAAAGSERHHICAYSLQSVEGAMKCSRCRGVWYSSKEAQRAHWKIHKHVCEPLGEMANAWIQGMSLREASGVIEELIHHIAFGPSQKRKASGGSIAAVIRRIRHGLLNGEHDGYGHGLEDVDMMIHTTARSIGHFPDMDQFQAFYSMLWAAPGMAELLLVKEDLLTPRRRRRRAALSLGLPPTNTPNRPGLQDEEKEEDNNNGEEDDDDDDEEEEEEAERQASDAINNYGYLYFSLLLSSAIYSAPTSCGFNDGSGKLRSGGPVAAAAARRALELFMDSDVRESCPDATEPGSSLLYSVLLTYTMRPFPPLPDAFRAAVGVLKAYPDPDCMPPADIHPEMYPREDRLEFEKNFTGEWNGCTAYAVLSLLFIHRSTQKGMWGALASVRERAQLALFLAQESLRPLGKLLAREARAFRLEPGASKHAQNVLEYHLALVCGHEKAGDGSSADHMRWEIFKAAANGELEGVALFPPGTYREERAFFNLLLQLCNESASAGLEALGLGASTLPLQIVEQFCEMGVSPTKADIPMWLHNWWDTPLPGQCEPGSGKEDQMEFAKRKREALACVSGPTTANGVLDPQQRQRQHQ